MGKSTRWAGAFLPTGSPSARFDENAVLAMLSRRRAEGFEACAIALIHAWKYPRTEQRVIVLARAAGFNQISASHQVSPLVGLAARAATTVVDAYLSPVLREYVNRFVTDLGATPLYFMQSNGGLAAADDFQGKDACAVWTCWRRCRGGAHSRGCWREAHHCF